MSGCFSSFFIDEIKQDAANKSEHSKRTMELMKTDNLFLRIKVIFGKIMIDVQSNKDVLLCTMLLVERVR